MLQEVYAQGPNVSTNLTAMNSSVSWATSLSAVFGLATNLVIGVAVALAVIFLGIGGIKYITSKGDAKAADAARAAITNAVIGLVVAVAALAIKTLVLGVIGGIGTINGVTP